MFIIGKGTRQFDLCLDNQINDFDFILDFLLYRYDFSNENNDKIFKYIERYTSDVG